MEEEKKNQVKAFREGMKKSLKDLKEKYFSLPLGAASAVLEKAAPAAEELLRLTAEFADRYQAVSYTHLDVYKRQLSYI